jgi:hypothetical protein
MSVEAITWAFATEQPTLGTRLVLLALADHAGRRGDDEKMVAWPSVATLARKARLSKRATQYALRSLAEMGLIEQADYSPKGTAIYELRMGVQNLHPTHSGGEASFTGGVQPASPEPSIEPSVEEVSIEPSSSRIPTDVIRESLRPTGGQVDDNVNGSHGVVASSITPGPGPVALCRRLAELMLANDPKAKVEPESKRWLDAARLLVDSDGRHFEEALAVLEWSQQDEFWRTNVLSMPTFRKQYPRLRMRWQVERQGAAAARTVSREKPAPASTAELLAAYGRPHTRTGL